MAPKTQKWPKNGPKNQKMTPPKKIKKKFYSFSRLIIAWGTLYFFWSIFFFFRGPNFFFFWKIFIAFLESPQTRPFFSYRGPLGPGLPGRGPGGESPRRGGARGGRESPPSPPARARGEKVLGFFWPPLRPSWGQILAQIWTQKKWKIQKKITSPQHFFFKLHIIHIWPK